MEILTHFVLGTYGDSPVFCDGTCDATDGAIHSALLYEMKYVVLTVQMKEWQEIFSCEAYGNVVSTYFSFDIDNKIYAPNKSNMMGEAWIRHAHMMIH